MEEARVASHQKGAQKAGALIVFVDESGFSQRPSVRRTWAPKGCTPVTDDHVNWKTLSGMGAIGWRPKEAHTRLFLSLRQQSIKQDQIVEFLGSLRRHVRSQIVLLWDRLSIHRGGAVKRYIAHRREWLRAEYFPPYAPELNPVENLWANLDSRELANHAADALHDLARRIDTGKRRVRRADLGLSFIKHAGLLSEKEFTLLRETH